jgi:glycine/D-amino acid oxidase-like deaminating enzyme
MDLHTNYPFSLIRHGIIASYPSLNKNVETDVAIIGAGVTGALVAWHLQQKGMTCVVVDKRHVGMGSTAASTSLIQYEIDVPLHRLATMVGRSNAIAAYQLCKEAVGELEALCNGLQRNLFQPKCSLQFASTKEHVSQLKKEFNMRSKNGFDVELLTKKEVNNDYGFEAPAALLTKEAGQLDAYVLTHSIFQKIKSKQTSIYDHTSVQSIQHEKEGVVLKTETGYTIKAKKLVIACGYESQKYIPKKIEDIKCTYAMASEAGWEKELWKDNCLIWETANPYIYLRTTTDNRMIIGGEDTIYYSADKQKTMLKKKALLLANRFHQLFPERQFKADFQWSGAFGNTKDGLPYVGCIPQLPDTYFALGYGGNGITFSWLAAQLIAAEISGKRLPHFDLFSFNR